MKGALVAAVPASLDNSIGPVMAAFGTTTRTDVSLALLTRAVSRVSLLPANVTTGSLALTLSDAPVSITSVPTVPRLGVKSEMTGGANLVTTKSLGLVAVPPSVSTVTGPVAVSAG